MDLEGKTQKIFLEMTYYKFKGARFSGPNIKIRGSKTPIFTGVLYRNKKGRWGGSFDDFLGKGPQPCQG